MHHLMLQLAKAWAGRGKVLELGCNEAGIRDIALLISTSTVFANGALTFACGV